MHASWKVCDLVYDIFFLYSENLDIIKYSRLTTFFILFVQNPTSTRKKLVATALYGNLEIDFTTNLNKYFRSYQYFQSCTALFKKKNLTHCKAGSRHAIAIPLHQAYCLTCFYSYIKFYCPQVR